MTLKATRLSMSLETGLTNTAVHGNAPSWSTTMSLIQSFTSGTTANKADLAYVAERTVSSASNDDIDLAGTLTDALGNTITAAEIVAIMIANVQKDGTANTTSLTIGGAASNAWFGFVGASGDTVGPVSPGGAFLIMNPDASGLGAVTAGTGDILRVANASGASNTYQIGLLARTA